MRIALRLIPLVLMAAITVVGSRSEPTNAFEPSAGLPQGGGCFRFESYVNDCFSGAPPDQCQNTYTATGAFQDGPGLNQQQIQTVPCPSCNSSVTDVPMATPNPACCDQDHDGFNRAGCGAGTDCRDDVFAINPGAFEYCDGDDNNCNGQTDEGYDQDGDGYKTCQGDCVDDAPTIYPGAFEACDDLDDNDCDGLADCDDSNCASSPSCLNPDGCTPSQVAFCQSVQANCYNGSCFTPILLDTLGNGLQLTAPANGVWFDGGGGVKGLMSWPNAYTDDAWLALDRNGNGAIDSGMELFGNVTEQPPSAEKHGFLALAAFDSPQNGGNNDKKIDQRDSVFASLLLWRDTNHNGSSEPGELFRMRDLGFSAIELDYKLSQRTDPHGNKFRYRAKVLDARNTRGGRWAWDVILKLAP
jgi:hypothetical protein